MYQFGLTIRSSSSSFGSSEGGSSTLGTLDPLHLPLLDMLPAAPSQVMWQRSAEGSEQAPAQTKERQMRPAAAAAAHTPFPPSKKSGRQFFFLKRAAEAFGLCGGLAD
jgi:hypothetical protein